jgi:hypothetical protein
MNFNRKKLSFPSILLIVALTLVFVNSSFIYGQDSFDNTSQSSAAPADAQIYSAQMYAAHYKVSVDEALNRLKL